MQNVKSFTEIDSTTGYLTEYGKKLVRAADRSGGHVVIITDYDVYGLHIASKVSGIPRIGIDEETLNYFGLAKVPPLVLSYSPHLKKRDFLSNYSDVIDRTFLEHSRVEIDAVLAAVGSERLWEYIMQKLTTLFPKRDYNRVISEQPKSSSPGAIGDVEYYVKYLKHEATHTKWQEIQKSLADVEGMIDIIARRKEIENELQGLVTNDGRVKVIVSWFEELKTKLKIDSDEDFAKYRKDSKDAAETEAVDLNNIDDNDNQQENLDLDSDFEDDEQLGHEHKQEQRGAV